MFVQETEQLLSGAQIATLNEQMVQINPRNSLDEAILVNQFVSARTFIQSCV